jgi:hypothetical protein
VAAAVVSASCSDQPKPKCSASRGDFAAVYTLVSGTGDCSMLTGDVLSVQAYNPPQSSSDQNPNYDKATIAIQPSAITGLLGGLATDPNADDHPYGIGDFSTSTPGDDGFCVAPTLAPAKLRLPAVPADATMCPPVDAMPAVDVTYAFTNVRVYNTANAQGNELSADLAYTTIDASGMTCFATYHVRGLYPAFPCGVDIPAAGDDGGGAEAAAPTDDGATAEAGGDDAGGDAGPAADEAGAASDCDAGAPAPPAAPQMPSNDLCTAAGTGINPDFAVACDPNLLMCVLAKEPPSLR